MAKQEGLIKLVGRIGDLSFFKNGDEYSARKATGVSGDRIKTDPKFERTRENMAEFGNAGVASKLLCSAFLNEIKKISDRRMMARLNASFSRVIKADATNVRGQRNVIDGEAELLTGFEFNGKTSLRQSFYAPYVASIDRASGNLTVEIAAFVSNTFVTKPEGATHFQLVATAAEIDFTEQKYVTTAAASPTLAMTGLEQPAVVLTSNIPGSTKPLFLSLSIQFFMQTNGTFYPMKNASSNAMTIVAVDGGV